jgi:Mg-chelatase subunit ChlD
MNKRNLLKIFSVIFVAVILLPFVLPGQVLSWSAVMGNRTHSDIDAAAYKIISADPAFKNVKFPDLKTIQDNDFVNPIGRTGPGPDVVGSSKTSAHFYNPRLEAQQMQAGGGPDASQGEFTKLINALNSGTAAEAAHAASWLAHYAADLYTPYHTQGASRADILKIYNAAGGRNATAVPLPSYVTGPFPLSTQITWAGNNFKQEIEAFLSVTANHTATEEWFDPWYWDGPGDPMLASSHVLYEATTFVMPGSLSSILSRDFSGGVKGYSNLWSNPTPSFDNAAGKQAAKIRAFALSTALVTQQEVDRLGGVITFAAPWLRGAVESAATVWRASFSALAPTVTFSVPDKTKPQKLKVTGTVMNTSKETAYSVQYQITVTGGTLKSGEKSKVIDDIGGGYGRNLEWEVEASNLGYCTVKLEIIGNYKDTPDLQYAVAQVTAPGIIPVSQTNTSARRSHSIVFCLDNSYSMNGQPIIDAMNAGVQAVTSAVGSELEMALYFFGTNACDPPVRIVDFTVDRERIKAAIRTASARGNTPLATSITTAGEYIHKSGQGEAATIILLTDGLETCSGDPVAAARALNPNLKIKTSSLFTKPLYAASNTPIKLQVVGFNIKSTADETKLKNIAQAGNGSYYPATGLQQLVQALSQAVKEGTGSGFEFQLWWFIVGGAVLLLFIILLARRGKRTPAPAVAIAGVSNMAPPQMAQRPAVNAPPSAPFCPNCGSRVLSGAAFCTGCGKPLTQQSPAFCPGCGTSVTAGSAFCNKCGSSLTANMPYSAVQAAQPPAGPVPADATKPAVKKAWGGWWLIAIFLLLPGGLIAWAVVKKENPAKAGRLLLVSLLATAFVFYAIVQNIIN